MKFCIEFLERLISPRPIADILETENPFFQQLIRHLNNINPISREACLDLATISSFRVYEKGEFLIKKGQKAREMAFVIDGVFRAFYRSKEGFDYNKTFFMGGSFAGPLAALLQDTYSYLYFQALLPSRIIVLDFHKFIKMFEAHRCLETLMRKVNEIEWIIKKEKREISLVIHDATERYALFQEEYPGLENLIPQYHIASHLGITPIQLSRIRAQLSKTGSD